MKKGRIAMDKKWRILFTLVMGISFILALTACGGNRIGDSGEKSGKTLTIAYQGGIGFAPVHVMETQKLIEKNYGDGVSVKYVKLDSGAAINEGIIGGTIDIGCMGLAPAISGVSKGIPYKAIANLCSQPYGMMSNDPAIKTLADIKPTDKIALVAPGAFPHIILGMAAEKTLGDAHVLDNNIQRMSHAEGMAALESGTVKIHLTTSPFIYKERANSRYVELPEIRATWPRGNTFVVAMASEALAKDEKIAAAVRKSFAEATEFINKKPEETVKIEAKYLGLDEATVSGYLKEPDCQFFSEVRGMKTMADFMLRAGFIEKAVSFEEFSYPGLKSGKD